MEFIKKYWSYFVIGLLAILFISKCTKSSNIERKYKAECKRSAIVEDSLKNVIMYEKAESDSLKMENKSLQSQLGIYIEQNNRLNDRNTQLSKNPVVIKVTDNR